jgi:hypothetical protein
MIENEPPESWKCWIVVENDKIEVHKLIVPDE